MVALPNMNDQRAAYRRFCREQPHLPVFVQDWYLDAVCEGGTWNAAVVEENGKVIAALPYFLKKKGPLQYVTMPPFTKHMGPLLHPDYNELKDQHKLYKLLIDKLPPLSSFKQNFTWQASNWIPFYWKGFAQTTRYTYQLDLQDIDQVYRNFNRNIRRNIKKAQQQVKVEIKEDLEHFYLMNQLSYERQGLPIPYSLEQLRRHDEALSTHQSRAIFFATDPMGQTHSAAYLIWDRQSSYYHLSGDDTDLRQSGAGILLAWEAIRYTAEILALPLFDFEGSMMPNVERIRRQFGARQQPYFFVWRYSSKLMEWMDALKGSR